MYIPKDNFVFKVFYFLILKKLFLHGTCYFMPTFLLLLCCVNVGFLNTCFPIESRSDASDESHLGSSEDVSELSSIHRAVTTEFKYVVDWFLFFVFGEVFVLDYRKCIIFCIFVGNGWSIGWCLIQWWSIDLYRNKKIGWISARSMESIVSYGWNTEIVLWNRVISLLH